MLSAMALYKRVYAGCLKVQGADHLETLTAGHALAVYLLNRRFHGSTSEDPSSSDDINTLGASDNTILVLLQRTLAGYERTVGTDQPDALRVVMAIASFYYNQERYADSLPYLERAVAGV